MIDVNICQFDLENSSPGRSIRSIWHIQSNWLRCENVMEEFASSWNLSPGCMVWPCMRWIGLIDIIVIPCGVEACDYQMKVNYTLEMKLRCSHPWIILIQTKTRENWSRWHWSHMQIGAWLNKVIRLIPV
jgi:hypothetical protein